MIITNHYMVVTENRVVATEEGGLKGNPKYMRSPSNGDRV